MNLARLLAAAQREDFNTERTEIWRRPRSFDGVLRGLRGFCSVLLKVKMFAPCTVFPCLPLATPSSRVAATGPRRVLRVKVWGQRTRRNLFWLRLRHALR